MDSGVTQQVVQIFPEEYQPLIATISAIAIGIFGLAMFLMPFISKWASNRQVAAINDSAITPDEVATAIEVKLNEYKKADTLRKIGEWKYKLIYASTDEAIQMCNSEISKLEAEMLTYA